MSQILPNFGEISRIIHALLTRPAIATILKDDFDIDDHMRGTGPQLCCLTCQSEGNTQVGAHVRTYELQGPGGPWHTLDCVECLEELVRFAE